MTSLEPERELESAFSLRRWLRLNLALLALTGLICLSMPVLNLDQRLGDLLFRMRGNRPTSGRVALVLIDDATLARYGRWPWPRRELARLLRVTSSFHPKAVGIDILLADREDEANDSEMAAAIAATPNVVLASKISGSLTGSLWVDPIPIFANSVTAVGHVQATLDADGVCRQIPIAEPSVEGPRFAFALKLAELVRPDLAGLESSVPDRAGDQGVAGAKHIVPQYLRINYTSQLSEDDRSPSYPALSAGDLLDGKRSELLRDKVVLIGFGGVEISDRLFTPVSGQIPMPGVELNANIVDMLLAGQQIREPGWTVGTLLLATLSVFMLWVVVRWPGLRGLLLLLGMLLITYGVGLVLFTRSRVLLHYGPVLVAGVLAAPLAQLENLLTVDGAVKRRLRDLQDFLKPTGDASLLRAFEPDSDSSVSLHWKLKTLRLLQARLGSLYTFDQTLLETMQEALAVFRADGTLLFHNRSWLRFCEKQGISTPTTLRTITDLMGGWPELEQVVWQAGTWQEKEAALKQGQWRIRAAQLPQTSHAKGAAIMLVAEDTTARQERDRARGEALSFVTHELRTPLIAIQGFAEFLMRYPDRSADSDAPSTIFREARRLVAMINAYLEVLRLDVGARPIRIKPVDIVAIARHVLQIVQPLAQAAGIQLRVENTIDVEILECDENLMSGALLNLLSNAVKYGPAGSEVILRIASAGESMEFAVHNGGPAIPAQDLEHLFEPFYRAAQTDSKPGWGLGLAFVKRIAEQHGGKVEVKSDSATGTCFRIILPTKSAVKGEVMV